MKTDLKEFWIRTSDQEKPLLVLAESINVFGSKGLIKLTRLFKDGETREIMIRTEMISSVQENQEKEEEEETEE